MFLCVFGWFVVRFGRFFGRIFPCCVRFLVEFFGFYFIFRAHTHTLEILRNLCHDIRPKHYYKSLRNQKFAFENEKRQKFRKKSQKNTRNYYKTTKSSIFRPSKNTQKLRCKCLETTLNRSKRGTNVFSNKKTVKKINKNIGRERPTPSLTHRIRNSAHCDGHFDSTTVGRLFSNISGCVGGRAGFCTAKIQQNLNFHGNKIRTFPDIWWDML